jgi:hypothetical protein
VEGIYAYMLWGKMLSGRRKIWENMKENDRINVK